MANRRHEERRASGQRGMNWLWILLILLLVALLLWWLWPQAAVEEAVVVGAQEVAPAEEAVPVTGDAGLRLMEESGTGAAG